MRKILIPVILVLCLFTFVCLYLKVTPDHLAGAAFCHQIPDRSPGFHFPFCYRCCGLFFGIFFGTLVSYAVTDTDNNIISKRRIIAVIPAAILFLLDILNSSKFPGFHLYNENVIFRFLSAYPLGYALARLISDIFKSLFCEQTNYPGKFKRWIEIPLFISSGILSYLLIFSEIYFLSLISRILLSLTAALFLCCLYIILIECFVLWRGKQYSIMNICLSGIVFSLLQISLTGFLHLRFLPFDQFL